MKYPTNIDIMLIIRHALHMISPERYIAPPGISISNAPRKPITGNPYRPRLPYPIKNENARAIVRNLDATTSQKASTLPRNTHGSNGTTSKSYRTQRNRSPGASHSVRSTLSGADGRTESLNSNNGLNERINHIQSTAAKSSVRMASHLQPTGQDPRIVDGYVENVSLFYD